MQESSPPDLTRRIEACFATLGVTGEAPLVAAVSGGPDSMALLDALAREPAWLRRLAVGHVDHGLRAESATEAAFVAEQCRSRGIPFFTTRLNIAPTEGRNLAAMLREARFQFLRSLVPAGGYLLTAHHADDQAVTMLMRFIEGAALPGLRGMRAQRDEIIRPFLATERRHLLAWLAFHHVPFCSDPSNEDTAKFRNRVRKEIWPLVLRERPGAAETLARSAQRLQEDDDALTDWAKSLETGMEWGENWAEIPAEGARAPAAVLRRLLASVTDKLWGATAPDGSQWSTALAALRAGRRANLPGRITVERQGEKLVLLHEKTKTPAQPLDISQPGDYVFPMGKLTVFSLSQKITVRPLQDGDRFSNGKRVVDTLTARGLSRHRRSGYPVVIDPSSKAIWSAPGEETDVVAGIGEFAFAFHSNHGLKGSKVMAPQIVKGATGAL